MLDGIVESSFPTKGIFPNLIFSNSAKRCKAICQVSFLPATKGHSRHCLTLTNNVVTNGKYRFGRQLQTSGSSECCSSHLLSVSCQFSSVSSEVRGIFRGRGGWGSIIIGFYPPCVRIVWLKNKVGITYNANGTGTLFVKGGKKSWVLISVHSLCSDRHRWFDRCHFSACKSSLTFVPSYYIYMYKYLSLFIWIVSWSLPLLFSLAANLFLLFQFSLKIVYCLNFFFSTSPKIVPIWCTRLSSKEQTNKQTHRQTSLQ